LSPQLTMLASGLSTAVVTGALGAIIRRNGPQGLVHGFGNWNLLDAGTRQRVGIVVGNYLFGISLLTLIFGAYGYLHADDAVAISLAALALVSGMSAIVLGMNTYLRRVQKARDGARRDG
jgi:hypothetical protein